MPITNVRLESNSTVVRFSPIPKIKSYGFRLLDDANNLIAYGKQTWHDLPQDQCSYDLKGMRVNANLSEASLCEIIPLNQNEQVILGHGECIFMIELSQQQINEIMEGKNMPDNTPAGANPAPTTAPTSGAPVDPANKPVSTEQPKPAATNSGSSPNPPDPKPTNPTPEDIRKALKESHATISEIMSSMGNEKDALAKELKDEQTRKEAIARQLEEERIANARLEGARDVALTRAERAEQERDETLRTILDEIRAFTQEIKSKFGSRTGSTGIPTLIATCVIAVTLIVLLFYGVPLRGLEKIKLASETTTPASSAAAGSFTRADMEAFSRAIADTIHKNDEITERQHLEDIRAAYDANLYRIHTNAWATAHPPVYTKGDNSPVILGNLYGGYNSPEMLNAVGAVIQKIPHRVINPTPVHIIQHQGQTRTVYDNPNVPNWPPQMN